MMTRMVPSDMGALLRKAAGADNEAATARNRAYSGPWVAVDPPMSNEPVIPGREANPESRDSPMRNCASEVWSFGPSRNDEPELFLRLVDRQHLQRRRVGLDPQRVGGDQ